MGYGGYGGYTQQGDCKCYKRFGEIQSQLGGYEEYAHTMEGNKNSTTIMFVGTVTKAKYLQQKFQLPRN